MSWSLVVIAAILLGYAAAARLLTGRNVSAAMYFTTAGLLAGPVLGLLDLHVHSEGVKLLAEVTLVLVLFADASRISVGALRREASIPLRLLGIGLPLTIAAGTAIGVVVLPDLSLVGALLVAVMLACTDAALGQAVVTDTRLPSRIRQGLNVESGLNDGLCVPIFLIVIAIAEAEDGSTSAGHAARIVGEQVGFGLLAGVSAGAAGAIVLRTALAGDRSERGWVQIVAAATAAASAGLAGALGGSIFIAAFTAGSLFALLRSDRDPEVTYLVDQTGELLNAVTFIVFGAVILGPMLGDLTWGLVAYSVLSLTVVRMLPVALSMTGTGARPATLGLLGWMGPRGLASIVFGVILLNDSELPGESLMLAAVAITVGLSVYAHGFTARPLTDRYVTWASKHPRGQPSTLEDEAVTVPRWRGLSAATPAARPSRVHEGEP